MSSYFRGPKATLVAAVRKTLDLLARDLAGGVGVKEIRCKRAQDERDTWEIELLS